MKKTTLLLLLLTSVFGFSQNERYSTENISEAEGKAASKIINLAVNPNTQNYDITYQKLELTVDPAIRNIAGKVTTTFTAKANMPTVTFDFYKKATGFFTISSVKTNGITSTFVYKTTHELEITLPTMLPSGNSASVEIIYSGIPRTGADEGFSIGTHSGTPNLWTLSEPFGAREWWPCKQDLNDKVNSIDVFITAPSQYISVSNGIEPEAPVIVGANKTTHFHHNYPIPAYLIAIAVTNYSIYNQTGGTTPYDYPIINYIYPENLAAITPQLAVTPQILNLYESLFEVYPYHTEKYGHAQFGWGGGMEHTTVSFMVGFDRGLIAHEMAHQWFGDKITCGSWKDIWLNEGITTYVTSLVIENFDGQAAFTTEKSNMIDDITSSASGAVYLTDAEAMSVNRIFSSRLTYNKGAMVMNMLRLKLGDAPFFQGLKNYLADPTLAYFYALTPQLKTHLEAVYQGSGSLTEFFNDWVYNQGYPIYTINAFNASPGQATVQINQTQSITNPAQIGYVSYFEMPVPVRLTLNDGQILDIVLENTFNGQSFNVVIPVGKTVAGIVFDPNKNIISRDSTTTLGIDNFNYDTAINMYPNPGKDILTIDLPTNMTLQKVSLYNALGQKTIETNQNKINVSGLSTGMYLVNFETSEGTFHKKFIKK